MSMSLQEISDRMEIENLIRTYGRRHDESQWGDWRELFTEDAKLMIPSGQVGPEEFIPFDQSVRERLGVRAMQRLFSNRGVEIDGDTAAAYITVIEICALDRPSGNLAMDGTAYDLTFRRTAAGWRISSMREAVQWTKLQDETPVSEFMSFAHEQAT